jgi:hypothetical protein
MLAAGITDGPGLYSRGQNLQNLQSGTTKVLPRKFYCTCTRKFYYRKIQSKCPLVLKILKKCTVGVEEGPFAVRSASSARVDSSMEVLRETLEHAVHDGLSRESQRQTRLAYVHASQLKVGLDLGVLTGGNPLKLEPTCAEEVSLRDTPEYLI